MSDKFKIRRENGLSNARVVINYVADADPGRIFPFDELAAILAEGINRQFTSRDVCQIVRLANVRLLKERKRELNNVFGVGFRLALASDHAQLAVRRKTKADKQMARGLLTLKNVRWDEMDENTRQAHVGQMLIMEGMYSAMQQLEQTIQRHDKAITDILQRTSSTNGQQVIVAG